MQKRAKALSQEVLNEFFERLNEEDVDDEELEEMDEMEKLRDKFITALAYGAPEDPKKVVEEGFSCEPDEAMKMIMWHCSYVEHVEVLKDLGYNFKDDEKCIEEFCKHAALKPEILQFMLDNGAYVSWKAIELCAKRGTIDVMKLLVDTKYSYRPH